MTQLKTLGRSHLVRQDHHCSLLDCSAGNLQHHNVGTQLSHPRSSIPRPRILTPLQLAWNHGWIVQHNNFQHNNFVTQTSCLRSSTELDGSSRNLLTSQRSRLGTPHSNRDESVNFAGKLVLADSCSRLYLLRPSYYQNNSKLNRIDEKINHVSQKIFVLANKSDNSFGTADVPSVPEGMKLTADTLKDLKNVASLVAQEDVRMKKQFVSIS